MGTAITTRFHGPSNTSGSRYSASAAGKPGGGTDRATLSSDHALSPSRNRATVARKLAAKLEWDGLWIAGGLNGSDVVYVRMPVSAATAAATYALLDKGGDGEDFFYLPPAAYFNVSANWKTWAGNAGGWSGNVRATSESEAMAGVDAVLRRRKAKTGYRSVDMSASAYEGGFAPQIDMEI